MQCRFVVLGVPCVTDMLKEETVVEMVWAS